MQPMREPWGLADPTNPVSEILPLLYMGGTLREQCIDQPQPLTTFFDDPRPYDAVVTLYAWAAPVGFGVEERRLGFPDANLLPEYVQQIHDLADWAHSQWSSGKRTFIRCAGGMNRSGLVTALVLMQSGLSAPDAITLIRERRSPDALSNSSFVKHIHDTESNQHA